MAKTDKNPNDLAPGTGTPPEATLPPAPENTGEQQKAPEDTQEDVKPALSEAQLRDTGNLHTDGLM